VGDAPSRGEVVVTDPLPPTINFLPPAGDGWDCTQTPAVEITCRRSDSLAPGASWPPITITGTVLSIPGLGFANTSTVEGGNDPNDSNNTSTSEPPPPQFDSLALEKTVSPDLVAPGDEVTYLLTVTNRSGFSADGVQLDDPLPAGMTLISAEALDQGTCSGAVTCSLGTLAGSATARVRVRARVGAQQGPGGLPNTARVTSSRPDHFPGDNEDSTVVNVRLTANLQTAKQLVSSPRAGRPVTWRVIVQNTGPHNSPGGDFVDSLPPAVDKQQPGLAVLLFDDASVTRSRCLRTPPLRRGCRIKPPRESRCTLGEVGVRAAE
jgi:uncharacterized repeat protein (TIGR01451 family)